MWGRVLSILSLCVLSACSMFDRNNNQNVQSVPENICVDRLGNVISCQVASEHSNEVTKNQPMPNINVMPHTLAFTSHTVQLGDYVEQIADDLMSNLYHHQAVHSIGVTSLIEYSSDYASVNLFGNMLSELFVGELHNNGFSVIDYKVNNKVTLVDEGDLIFSRDPKSVTPNNYMDYVLTGTLVYNKSGVTVNARIVNLNSKAVVATAKRTIPYFVLDNVIPLDNKNSVAAN